MASTTAVTSTEDVLLYFLAIFFPPLTVFIKRGCHVDLWINILLWILGWIPGVLHAWWIISKSERTVVVVAPPGPGPAPVIVPVGPPGGPTPVVMPVGPTSPGPAPVAVAVPVAPPPAA